MKMLKCKDVMSHKIKACYPHSTVKEAVSVMKEMNCGVVPVVDENYMVKGIVTDRDIALFVVLQNRDPETTRLEEFMNKDVITSSEDESIDDIVKKMKYYKIRRIPVVDNHGKLIGLISLGDIAVKVPEEEQMVYEAIEKISEPVHT